MTIHYSVFQVWQMLKCCTKWSTVTACLVLPEAPKRYMILCWNAGGRMRSRGQHLKLYSGSWKSSLRWKARTTRRRLVSDSQWDSFCRDGPYVAGPNKKMSSWGSGRRWGAMCNSANIQNCGILKCTDTVVLWKCSFSVTSVTKRDSYWVIHKLFKIVPEWKYGKHFINILDHDTIDMWCVYVGTIGDGHTWMLSVSL